MIIDVKNPPIEPIYIPPIGGGQNDAARFQAVLNIVPPGSTLRLFNGAVYTWTTSVLLKSNITIDLNGAIINFVAPYDLYNAPFTFFTPTPALTTTLSANVTPGVNVFPMTSAAAFAPGDYFFAQPLRGGRVSYRVVSVAGNNVTVDEPAWFLMENGTAIYKFVPLTNCHILFNDATLQGHFIAGYPLTRPPAPGYTGGADDQRIIFISPGWDCSIEGPGETIINAGGGIDPIAHLGFDVGGRHNLIASMKGRGFTPAFGAAFLGVEDNVGSTVQDCEYQNGGFALWLNSCHDCNINNLRAYNCFGIVFTTSISIAAPINELGCHGNGFYGLSIDGLLPGGVALWLASDTIDNTWDDIQIQGGDTQPALSVGIEFSTNGTLPASNNLFTNVIVKGVEQAFVNIGASTGNTINGLVLSNVSGIAQLVAGTDLTIQNVRGDIATNGGNQFVVPANASLHVEDMQITIARTTGSIFCTLGGNFFGQDIELTHSGAGYEYGFINSANVPGVRIELENCTLGTWATNSFYLFPGDAARLRGKVTYGGAVQAGSELSRGTVTLNGTTSVYFPLPGINLQDTVDLTRQTAGGTPGAPPKYAITAQVDSGMGAPATWGAFGLTGWPGSAPSMVEDNLAGAHGISTNAAGYVRGPALLICRLKNTGTRNFAKLRLSFSESAVFNLTTGAVTNITGTGTIAWAISDGAGGFNCYFFSPDMSVNSIEILMQAVAGTDVYLGNGSGENVLSGTLTLLGKVAVDGIAADTSQYAIDVGN